MGIREDRRAAALERIAAHLLEEGLPGSSLRSLAAASGVSDRMLLYYFADKNELLTSALGLLAMRMGAALDQASPVLPKRPFSVLLGEIRRIMKGPELRPFMRLWLDITSRAARDEPPYNRIAGIMVDGFENWVVSRLQEARPGEGALLFAAVEGCVMLDAVGRETLADAAVPSSEL